MAGCSCGISYGGCGDGHGREIYKTKRMRGTRRRGVIMESLTFKLPLLILSSYCVHTSQKSPNPPAQREEQQRFLGEKKLLERILRWLGTTEPKIFRVHPSSPANIYGNAYRPHVHSTYPP